MSMTTETELLTECDRRDSHPHLQPSANAQQPHPGGARRPPRCDRGRRVRRRGPLHRADRHGARLRFGRLPAAGRCDVRPRAGSAQPLQPDRPRDAEAREAAAGLDQRPAMGASASLALACDFRIMSEDARMALLFTRIGLAPDAGASYILPRLVGVDPGAGDDDARRRRPRRAGARLGPGESRRRRRRPRGRDARASPSASPPSRAPPGWSSDCCARR